MSARGSNLRYKSIKQVKSDLKRFFDAKTPIIKFVDRTFNAPIARATEILDYLHEIDNGITTCHLELSPSLLSDAFIEKISSLRTGLVQFEIGIQSTNETTIHEINRLMPTSSFEQVKKLCLLTNCHTHLDLIAGLPYETSEIFEKSFNDVLAMKPDHLQLGMLKILHGSLIKDQVREFEYLYDEDAPYEFYQNKFMSFADKQNLVACEEGLEAYHNSELLSSTLDYLYKRIDSAYQFYEHIGSILIENKLYNFPDGFDNRLILLKEYVLSYTSIDLATIEGLMAFDLIKNGQKLPATLSHLRVETHGKWHDVIRNHTQIIPEILKNKNAKQLIKLMTVFKSNYHVLEDKLKSEELYYVKFKDVDEVVILDVANIIELKEFY
jgi:hypothetical protein